MSSDKRISVGVVGVRGYVGRELIRLLAINKRYKVDWVSSRQLKGTTVANFLNDNEKFDKVHLDKEHYYNKLTIETLNESAVASRNTDVIVLALPNGLAKTFIKELEQSDVEKDNLEHQRLLIDLSADYRFDDDWIYSVPELLDRNSIKELLNEKMIKVSNPGCYATAMQVALAPLVGHINGAANCFGISGYSGAGTTPSPNNDPINLEDNIIPYGLIEHLHEKEVSHHLKTPISFSPHVASFFRGISMTVQVDLSKSWSRANIIKLFNDFFIADSLVEVKDSIPNIQQVVLKENCIVGGFSLSENGKRLTVISCIDNLLKGAASQALQNIDIFCKTK